MGLNTSLKGKRYGPVRVEITARAIEEYADATNDLSESFRGPAPIAPPCFPFVAAFDLFEACLADPELGADMARVVHGAQDHRLFKTIKSGDVLEAEGQLIDVDDTNGGGRFTLQVILSNQAATYADIRSTLFVRGAGRAPVEPRPDRPEPLFKEVQKIDDDQPARYAEASKDRNRIHLDGDYARDVARLPGVICHGMCTMGIVSKAIVSNLCGGKVEGLRRLKVEFARPVFPGQTLTTIAWAERTHNGIASYGFETLGPRGGAVLKAGAAEVSAMQH